MTERQKLAILKGKTPKESTVETRYLIMPHHANPQGTVFGGVIMGWIDIVAGMAAQRHCGKDVVTAGIDSLVFKEPIRIGDHVVLTATINYVSRSSMEAGVQVVKEDPYKGERVLATTAFLTFVALDENKKPTPALPILPETADEQERYENAKQRVKARKELLKKIK
jgi:acyl-CoA hydrolase